MLVCKLISIGVDPARGSLSVTSSSQKLKAFAFSRGSQRDTTKSDGPALPPAKKPAYEKDVIRLEHTKHTSSLSPSTADNSRLAVKRKFPGPAGILPKLVRKLEFKYFPQSIHVVHIMAYVV